MNPGRGVNVPASVKARLHKLAAAWRQDVSDVFLRYANERLLWRIGTSPEADGLVLKGATRLMLDGGPPHRATRDVDLLATSARSPEDLAAMFRRMCAIRVANEGLVFDVDSIRATLIRESNRYGGVRVRMIARLDRTRIALQIDVGFGDALTRPAELRHVATLLGHAAPRLRVYPLETVVAEKLQIVLERGASNTRLKDYFDLHYLSRTQAFDGRLLVAAIAATLRRNRTALPNDIPSGLNDDFARQQRSQRQWSRVAHAADGVALASLAMVVGQLREFLMPLIDALRTGSSFDMDWEPAGHWRPSAGNDSFSVHEKIELRAHPSRRSMRRSA